MINTLRRNATLWRRWRQSCLRSQRRHFHRPRPTRSAAPSSPSAARTTWRHCSSVPPGGEAVAAMPAEKHGEPLRRDARARCVRSKPPAAPKAEAAPAAAADQAESAAAPKTEAAPAAATAKPAAETAARRPNASAPKAAAGTSAKKPSDAQVAAIRSSCRSDYPKVCAGVPTGGEPALNCLEKNKAKVSASLSAGRQRGRRRRRAPAKGGAAAAATAAAPAAAAPAAAPAPALVLRPMRPREELFVLRSACGGDVRALCGGVPSAAAASCSAWRRQAASISPACKEVLGQFAAQ